MQRSTSVVRTDARPGDGTQARRLGRATNERRGDRVAHVRVSAALVASISSPWPRRRDGKREHTRTRARINAATRSRKIAELGRRERGRVSAAKRTGACKLVFRGNAGAMGATPRCYPRHRLAETRRTAGAQLIRHTHTKARTCASVRTIAPRPSTTRERCARKSSLRLASFAGFSYFRAADGRCSGPRNSCHVFTITCHCLPLHRCYESTTSRVAPTLFRANSLVRL